MLNPCDCKYCFHSLNHITKKPKSLGKRKSWEQRAKAKVAITKPQTEGCTYQPLDTIPCSKVTSGFKSNLHCDIAEPRIRKATMDKSELITHHNIPKKDKIEFEPHLTSFDEQAYQAMISRYSKFNA